MVKFLIIITIALGPLQWITLANVGLTLKPVHIPYFMMSAVGWLYLFRSRMLLSTLQPGLFFAIPYIAYLTALLLTVGPLGGNFTGVIKNIIYFIGACGWFFALLSIKREDALLAVYRGGVWASIVFVSVAFITLQTRGINLFSVIGLALTTGNTGILQFVVFQNLFNDVGSNSDEFIGTALRHTCMGFIFIALITSTAFWTRGPVAKASAIFALCIILISVSRSLWVAVFLAFVPAITVAAMERPKIAFAAFFVMLFLGIVTIATVDLSGVIAIFDDRFGSLGDDGRIRMYSAAFDYIDRQILFGYGAGFEIDYGSRETVPVHNLFLAAWVQAGLLGLITSLAFTVGLLVFYGASLVSVYRDQQQALLLGLLVLPIFRSQISGGGGSYTLPEWICLAVVLGLVIPEALKQRTGGNQKHYRLTSPAIST